MSAEYSAQTIDSLTYSYASGDKNRLITIDDPAGDDTGFKNGASAGTEYWYDVNGNLTSDKNKGIDSIYYNFLGKPVRMDFADHRRIEYVYDAGGSKLTQKLYHYDTLKTTTHYANGFVYEAAGAGSPVLSFFGSPEGRVVNTGGTLTYEYSIADHQGNTRVVFSSAAPSVQTTTVDFEAGTNASVMNYGVGRTDFELFDHTDAGVSSPDYSQKLTGGSGSQVGITKTLKVYPGDKVKIEAYAKYYNPTSTTSNISGFALALTGAFGVTSSSTGEELKAYNTLNNYGGIIAAGGSGGSGSYPKLFVNILLFDKDYNFLDAAWEQIDGGEQVGASPKATHDLMSKEVTVKEAGFAYVFVSNENPTLVEFYVDDVVITHTPTNVIQYNEYYPFGLQTSSSWIRDSTKDNNYLYNAANELNKTSGWYEMFYRGYDPAIGRMLQVDPYAPMYASTTTYNYSLNNPVMMNDPSGGYSVSYNADGISDVAQQRMYKLNYYHGFGGSDWAESYNVMEGGGQVLSAEYAAAAMRDLMYDFKYGRGAVSIDRGLFGTVMDAAFRGEVSINGMFMTVGYSNRTETIGLSQSDKDKYNIPSSLDKGIVTSPIRISIETAIAASKAYLCSKCIDPSTLNRNLLGLSYPGGDNPLTYSGDYSYTHVPKSLAEYPAIGHDRSYDKIGATGASGLFLDTRTVVADWKFVGQELTIASNIGINTSTRFQAGVLGTGLGLAALPKTVLAFATPGSTSVTLFWGAIATQGVTNTPDKHSH